jgi:molybdate transport system substrate-binding protein
MPCSTMTRQTRRSFVNRIMRMGAVLLAPLVVAVPLVLSAPGPAGAATPKLSGSITVSAASSLTTAFNAIAANFEKKYKGTSVTFNYGSSATLVTQIQGGAPADVFASADLTNMDKLVSTGYVTAVPTIFARNSIEIAVKPGNPHAITSVAALPTAGTIAMCATTAPCGIYAANVLTKAKVTIPPSSITRQPDAASTIGQVTNGDAVAALVYVSDVVAAGNAVTGVVIPPSQNVTAFYPIAPLAASTNPKLAKAFSAYVASSAGQKVLVKYGFLPPAGS